MRLTLLCLGLLLAAADSACAEEILVFAAASTTDALSEIGRSFQHQTANRVTFSFAGSSTLARQIMAGAPADVFLSADTAEMHKLEREELVISRDVIDLLSNQLVVVVPRNSPLRIATPDDLRSVPAIALADPAIVPAGIYARKWLESLRLWDALKSRIVPALDVRAALAAVATGAADAGVVYKSDALISMRVRVVYSVAPAQGPRIVYQLAKIATSNKKAAREFVDFLAGPQARETFQRWGFIVK